MDEVLFCPFCGEAFEGLTRCPEHDLALEPWRALHKRAAAIDDHERLPWYSPIAGRAWVACPACVILLAFAALPIAHVDGALQMGGSMLRLALHNTPRLWLVPAAACAELLIMYRRRSLAALRGARLAVLCAGIVPAAAVTWTWLGARAAIAVLASRMQIELQLRFGAGAYLVWAATAPLLFGALRLGVSPSRDHGTGDSGVGG
jgi:hypothetical protein